MKEGNKPGVTRGLQWAKIGPYFEVLDTPGILMPKIESEETAAKIAAIGCIPMDILDFESIAYFLIQILTKNSPNLLKKRYNLDSLSPDANEVLSDICKVRGFLLKGGEMDRERGAKILLAAGGDPAGISAATVAAAAAAGDTAAEGIIARAARYLGIGIAGIINLLNPSLVILGGGVMNIGELIWQNLGPEVQARSLEAAGKNARLKGAELGVRAGVMGAIALALMNNQAV
jgi:hypothetical protein